MRASNYFTKSLVRCYPSIYTEKWIFYYKLPFISHLLQLEHSVLKFSVRSDYIICEIYFRRLKGVLRIICYKKGVRSVSNEIHCSNVMEGAKTRWQGLQRNRTSRAYRERYKGRFIIGIGSQNYRREKSHDLTSSS